MKKPPYKDSPGAPDDPALLQRRHEKELWALTQKLNEALDENKALYERIAALDINTNIEKVELKKEIDSLTYAIDSLFRENEGLLGDFSWKDQELTELRRSMEIKTLQIEEANRYVNTAKERIKEYEAKCGELEARHEALKDENAALAGKIRETADQRDISEQRYEELGDLERELERFKEENAKLLASVAGKKELENSLLDAKKETARLAGALLEKSGRPASLEKTALRALLFLLLIAGIWGTYQGGRVYFSSKASMGEERQPVGTAAVNPWAEGVKKAGKGVYTVSLTFLNKEAASVIGLSDKITDADMAQNHYFILEIKAEGGCIPEDFFEDFQSKVSFIDKAGAAVPLSMPGTLEEEKRVVYKARACGDKTGAVYLRRVISVGKNTGVEGAAINGLMKEAPVILR